MTAGFLAMVETNGSFELDATYGVALTTENHV
jgi:hypothetical protein